MNNPLLPFRLLLKRGFLAMVVGVILNMGLLLLVTQANLVMPFGALTAPPVLFLTIFSTVAATVVYGAITRISPYPDRVFIALAGVVLLLSFIPNVIMLVADPEATTGAVLTLMGMHVIVAGTCVYLLTDQFSILTRSPERPDEQPNDSDYANDIN